jgi:hypothetical protein
MSSVCVCVKYESFCFDTNQNEINSIYITTPKFKVPHCLRRFSSFYAPHQDMWTDLTNVTAGTQSMHRPVPISTHNSAGSNMPSLFPFILCADVCFLCNFMLRISIKKYVHNTFSVIGLSLPALSNVHLLANHACHDRHFY